jgi:hypothetical protein
MNFGAKPMTESTSNVDENVVGREALLRCLDRVVLSDVKKAWAQYQSTRDRSAIYAYLHMVFMQVDWWKKNAEERRVEIGAFQAQNPAIRLPADEFAAVLACTTDPKKVDVKTRSKWSRVLHYAEKYKPADELLRDFLQRKGGINRCAGRYAHRLRRQAKRDARLSASVDR